MYILEETFTSDTRMCKTSAIYLLELYRPTRSKVILIYLLSQRQDNVTSIALSLQLSYVKLGTLCKWEVWTSYLCI